MQNITKMTILKRPDIPVEIIIEITGKCKLVCPYCTDSRRPHVPLKDILHVLDEIAELGVKAIRITGGEPLLHPDLVAILNYSKKKKFIVTLNSTAEDIAPHFMKAIIKNVDVGLFSLQGYSAQTNAAYTRSKSSFLEKIKNIFFLKTQLPTVRLATVLTPRITGSFPKFVSLIEKVNPSAWVLLRPISAMTDDLQQMDIPFYRALTLNIMKARKDGINVFIGNPLPMCITGDLRTGKQAFMGAISDDGHFRLVYSAQGFYKPSYFINTNLGNTLKKAWDHPLLKELDRTDYLPDICRQCPVLYTCMGGCRAMTLKNSGSAFGPDPLFEQSIAVKAVSKYQRISPSKK